MTSSDSSTIKSKWNHKAMKVVENREEMIKKHINLVKYVLSRMINTSAYTSNSIDYEDLYSCGVLGLIEAVDGFDPSRDVKFSTYAIPRIRGSIVDELRARDFLPRLVRQKLNEIQKAYSEIEKDHLRSATDAEVREKLGYDVVEFNQLLMIASCSMTVSIDETITGLLDNHKITFGELLADSHGEDPHQTVAREEMVALLQNSISNLPEKERLVMTLYYHEELTFKEIGEVLEVTESRVCQLHAKAILRLRGRLSQYSNDFLKDTDSR